MEMSLEETKNEIGTYVEKINQIAWENNLFFRANTTEMVNLAGTKNYTELKLDIFKEL